MSAEIYDDVAELYRKSRNRIEKSFNKAFSQKHYGDGVKEWAFIAIILPPEIDGYKVEGYTEYRRYHKDEKSVEFRLRIDYFEFRKANESKQIKLICEGLIRSLERLDKNPIPDFDHMKLKEDFMRFCKTRKWL